MEASEEMSLLLQSITTVWLGSLHCASVSTDSLLVQAAYAADTAGSLVVVEGRDSVLHSYCSILPGYRALLASRYVPRSTAHLA